MKFYTILALILALIISFYFYKLILSKESFNNFNKNKLFIVTKIFKESCDKLGLKYKIQNSNIITIYNNNKSITFNKLYNNIHTKQQKFNAIYKYQTSLLLSKFNLPVPIFNVFDISKNNKEINKIINSNTIKFPLVIKPPDGAGGKNVFVNIKNQDELKRILKDNILNNLNFSKTNKVMIEEYIKIASNFGSDHRILCYKNIILDVIQRKSPYIIGNGKNTIKELILIANKIKIKKRHHKIKLNENYIKKKGFNENSILDSEYKLVVNPISNFHQGGFLEIIPLDKIHPDNLEMFKKVNGILDLKLCGIDFLIKDITKSYKTQECAINEVNSSPHFDIHYYTSGLKIPIKFLKLYFDIN